MNRIKILLIGMGIFLISCSGNSQQNMDAKQFSDKLAATTSPQLVDVRTPGEFASGHIKGAINLPINRSDFQTEVAKLDKSKPVFLYCLSGARSASAMGYLMQNGFKEVYNLQRGTLSWQSAGLALESSSSPSSNPTMTLAQLKGLSANNKTILVDFYAEWCGPCKKMEPFLAEIAKEKAGQVQVVRIDVDANPALAQELKIEAIPFLQVYKNENVTWSNIGLVAKEDVVKNL